MEFDKGMTTRVGIPRDAHFDRMEAEMGPRFASGPSNFGGNSNVVLAE